MAARRLPVGSRIEILHVGGARDPRAAGRARAEERRNARYRWVGERPRAVAMRLMAGSHLLVHPSRLEGGANVIGEAATLGVPILASRVSGNEGLLGRAHPGLFACGDTNALRDLLLRAERDARFYARLERASARIAPLFRPTRELRAWRALLRELEP
jgi:glycosyltransferase involved in cell wall biosynthesis